MTEKSTRSRPTLRATTDADNAPQDPGDVAGGQPRGKERGRFAVPGLRRWRQHLPFAVLFAAGLGLRVVTVLGFRPAFAWPDSAHYLASAGSLTPDTLRPSGYSVFLRILPDWTALWPEAVVQHALGLAMAGLIYWSLRRRAVPTWAASLATVPVLLDPWQITLEHDVLADVLFEFLLVLACVVLTVRRRLGPGAAVTVGLLLGVAVTVRSVGLVAFVPVGIAVLLGQARWRPALTFVVAFAVPVAAYAGWYHSAHGSYTLSQAQSRQLYGRVATFVDCRGLTLPRYERPLCPRRPPGHRYTAGYFTWGEHSPLAGYAPPRGKTLESVLTDFERRALTHQPVAYGKVVAADFLRGFAPSRAAPLGYPVMTEHIDSVVALLYGARVRDDPGLTGFLRSYGTHVWVPGPLFACCLLAGAAAVVGAGRSRRSGLRSAVGAYVGLALAVLLIAPAAAQFSWRYQLPQFVLLPPAAALAGVAVLRREPDPVALTGRAVTARLTERLPLPAGVHELLASDHRVKVGRYFMGSIICTVISTVTFMAAFGFGLLGSRGASLLSSATGALAGYWLNRTWTWGRRGKADFRRELLPYWITIIGTAVAAAVVTGLVNHVVAQVTDHHGIRTMFDAAAFLGTYVAFFVLKYAVFNRLFGGQPRGATAEGG